MKKQIIVTKFDEETGEVYSNSQTDYKSKLWVDGKGAIIKPRNYHYTLYQDTKLCDIIKDKNDLFKTYILVEHIYKNTNIIYIKTSKTVYKPASIEDMSSILDISVRRTKEYIKRMIDIGIIARITLEIKDKEYVSYAFNPVFVNSCKYINNTLYLLFKPYIDKCCPQWIIDKYEEMNRNYGESIEGNSDIIVDDIKYLPCD